MRKPMLVAALGAMLVLAIVLGGGTQHTQAFVPPGIQDFDLDMVHCLLPSYPPDTKSPDPMTGPYQVCAAGEDKAVGPQAGGWALSTGLALIEGNRLGYPYVYNGPGWVLQDDAAITNGTKVGDVASVSDFFQDGTPDIVGDASNCGGNPTCSPALTLATAIPEDYLEQTTAWGPGTGCTGENESYLTQAMPGTAAMTKYVRYRACVDTLFLGGTIRITLPVPTPLNLVTLTPNWSPAGTHVNLVTLSGAANSPTTLLQGLDSPQASISHTLAPYTDNPAAPGLYVRWMTELSAADEGNGALNFVYSTNCKAIGGSFTDNDHDCLATTANGGGPADPNDNNPDMDGDGLLDGVEVAWGSCPGAAADFPGLPQCAGLTAAQARDTDSDGRTDLEEMIGPTQFLTDPTKADTDGDGRNDGGYKVDLNADGAPDCPDENGDSICDSGISTNKDTSSDGSSHVRVGYKIVGRDILPDGAGRDNCPSTPNADQKNTDFDSVGSGGTGLGNGDLYGDACDGDKDNDELPDGAEVTNGYSAGQCNNAGGAVTNPLNPDSDGDTVLDGVECLLGTNPASAASKPAPATSNDADKDGLTSAFETYQRSQGFSNQRAPRAVGSEDVDGDTLIGDADWDSDNDGVSDPCEALVTGTSLLRADTDGNGTPDIKEPNARSNVLEIGNGASITTADLSVPWQGSALNCSLDGDNDGLPNVTDPDPGGDITYDDNNNGIACVPMGTDAADDGPSWDANCNGVLDGREGICPLATNPNGDDDGDGLLNGWEVCKWGTYAYPSTSPLCTGPTPAVGCAPPGQDPTDTDNDGKGDCIEAVDTDGNGIVDFGGDALNSARATLLPAGVGPGKFGKDGDFDLNGNNVIVGDFGKDTLTTAKIALHLLPCK